MLLRPELQRLVMASSPTKVETEMGLSWSMVLTIEVRMQIRTISEQVIRVFFNEDVLLANEPVKLFQS